MQVFSYAERPDLVARLDEVDDIFPEFIHHADVTDLHWAKLRAEFPELQVLLYDDEQDRVVGCGQTIPASTRAGLPGGAPRQAGSVQGLCGQVLRPVRPAA